MHGMVRRSARIALALVPRDEEPGQGGGGAAANGTGAPVSEQPPQRGSRPAT